ncbi:MAG: glycoside hydrolase family 28 protein [Prevotellaceae bacterium]|nr:glycoside hydrolase family 28 protein [Prevotellaceae bacterium]
MKKLLLLLILPVNFLLNAQTPDYSSGPWAQVPAILAEIVPPSFRSVDYEITAYGAVSGGSIINTVSIQNAIDACSADGGGRVVVPQGTFLTGALKLKNNVNLHLAEGAILLFSTNMNDYLPVVFTRFEGMECWNYSPFIYAYEQTNIAITGSGTLDGNSANMSRWRSWKGSESNVRNSLMTMVANNTPVENRIFGNTTGTIGLRPVFIQPYNCQNVLIEGIKIRNSPMWEINPVLCSNVTVKDLDISSKGPNNDGCNPESSKNVWIKNCVFDTGDDCIAIKSGRNNDGRRINVPSENIIIQGCTMKDGHGGVTMGSELSGGIRNVFVEDCVMNSNNLDRALRIKTNWVRGGVLENVYMRNCTVQSIGSAFFQIDMEYEEGDDGEHQPVVRNFEIENIEVIPSCKVFDFRCFSSSAAENITLKNCTFGSSATKGTLDNVRGLQLVNTLMNGANPLYPTSSSSQRPTTGYTHSEVYAAQTNWGWSNTPSFKGSGYMEPVNEDNNSIAYNLAGTLSRNERHTITLRYINTNTEAKSITIYAQNDAGVNTLAGEINLPAQNTFAPISGDIDLPESTAKIAFATNLGVGIDEYKLAFKEEYTPPQTSISNAEMNRISIPVDLPAGFYTVLLFDKNLIPQESTKIVITNNQKQLTFNVSRAESVVYKIVNAVGAIVTEGSVW